MTVTVFGAGGFIGRALVDRLHADGVPVRAIVRGDDSWRGATLGHVIYAIGLTADFRSRPFDTVSAHVGVLADVLAHARFDSFLYCSSTRVYAGAPSTAEDTPLTLAPANPDQLYNATKLAGEALCLALPSPRIRVARLSNVYGDGMGPTNFLGSVIAEALEGHIHFRSALVSAKDYIDRASCVDALLRLALHGGPRLINIAAGRNCSHQDIGAALAALTGCRISVAPDAPVQQFPPISVERLRALGLAPPPPLETWLARLLASAGAD